MVGHALQNKLHMNSLGGDCFVFEFRWPARGPLQQFPRKVPSSILLCATILANDLIPRSLDGAGPMGSPSRVGLHDGDILRGWIAQQYAHALQSPFGILLTPQRLAQQQLGQDTSTCPQVNTAINGMAPPRATPALYNPRSVLLAHTKADQ